MIIKEIFLITVLYAISTSASFGQIIIDVTGTSGSSIITVEFSGSDTLTSTGTYVANTVTSWDGTIAGAALNGAAAASPISGSVTYTYPQGSTTVDSFYIRDSSLRVHFTNSFNYDLGDPISASGSFTCDLDAMNSGATFDDLNLGTYTSSYGVYNNGYVLNISAVPEPSTYAAIAGIIALGFSLYSRRKNRKR